MGAQGINNEEYCKYIVGVENEIGKAVVTFLHWKRTGSYSFVLSWRGGLPGEPNEWRESWHWTTRIAKPPQDLDRPVKNAPDRTLVEEALAELNEKLPQDFFNEQEP
jgi:hypothetical protein